MNEIEDNKKIENMIYEIRGKQVMLDSDLAKLYECVNGTKTINQAVTRNNDRFPNDFYFQITKEEFDNLKSQVGTSSWNNYGGIRKLPYVFTEQGVAMLATVIRTDVATKTSINIIRAFVLMRKYISTNLIEQKYINNMVFKLDERVLLLETTFDEFQDKKKINEIYFNGQIFDAYFKIYEIFNEGKEELIVIDSYADNTILDIIKRLNINVILITKFNNLLTEQDIEKYNKQYHNLKVIYDNTFHDRYFIIDSKVLYHCGASVNRIGYKTFSITKVNDECMLDLLLNRINELLLNNF